MSASTPYESALRPYRLEFVRETAVGSFPSNPAFEFFSDNIRTFEPGKDDSMSDQFGLGSPDAQNAFTGTNADSLTVEYDLQQKSGSGNTFLDNSSNPNDAITDAWQRDSDNRIQNTHTIVRRITQSSIASGNTVNGSTSKDTRQYVVAVGAYPDEGTLTGDPSDGQPILASIGYECERIDTYQIDQPGSSTMLDVTSSSTSDTTQTLTIEDEDRNTNEDVTLSGTSTVTTSGSFSDIDVLMLDSETAGDITISENGGDNLAVLRGQNSQDTGEGQLGIPALGSSGSRASAIGNSYELYHDDSIERPSGTSIADNFETTEFTVANNTDGTEQGGTPRRALAAGNREPSAEVVVFGETEMHDYTLEHIQSTTTNLRWTMSGGYVELSSASVPGVDPDTEEPGQGKKLTTLTMNAQGISIST